MNRASLGLNMRVFLTLQDQLVRISIKYPEKGLVPFYIPLCNKMSVGVLGFQDTHVSFLNLRNEASLKDITETLKKVVSKAEAYTHRRREFPLPEGNVKDAVIEIPRMGVSQKQFSVARDILKENENDSDWGNILEKYDIKDIKSVMMQHFNAVQLENVHNSEFLPIEILEGLMVHQFGDIVEKSIM